MASVGVIPSTPQQQQPLGGGGGGGVGSGGIGVGIGVGSNGVTRGRRFSAPPPPRAASLQLHHRSSMALQSLAGVALTGTTTSSGPLSLITRPPETYSPLNPGRREIRLLHILPGSAGDDIRCSLRVVSLDAPGPSGMPPPTYNALSYAWGGSERPRTVELNGRRHPVTASLHAALRHLRSLSTPLLDGPATVAPLWVDALCINQRDRAERNSQVALMGDVFAAAARVVVFLGEGNERTDFLFRAINSSSFRAWLESGAAAAAAVGKAEDLAGGGGGGGGGGEVGGSKERARITRAVTAFWAFFDVFSRPWWRRVWVVQEVALARQDPVLVCGTAAVGWAYLSRVQADLLRFSTLASRIHLVDWSVPGMQEAVLELADLELRKAVVLPYYSLLAVRGLVDEFRSGEVSIFAFQTFFMGSAQATDPRDYVYGYRGLVSPAVRDYLNVDYAKNPMQVYYEIMVLLWLSRDTVRMNFIEQFSFARPTADDFPSWVPDLSRQHIARAPAGDNNRGLFPPDGAAIWRWGEVPELEDDGKTLMMRGVFIDIVRTSDEMRFVDSSSAAAAAAGGGGNSSDGSQASYIMEFWRIYNIALAVATSNASTVHPLGKLRILDSDGVLDVLTQGGTCAADVRAVLRDIVELGKLVGNDPGKMKEICGFLGRMARTLSSEHTAALLTLVQTAQGRSLITTETGFVGVGLCEVQSSDVLAFLFGMSWPWILRPGRPGYYSIIGPAYIGGFHDFDLLNHYLEMGALQTEVFAIR